MMHTVPAFRMRWFVENCCQIELPNGKVIVIDPILFENADQCTSPMEKKFVCGFSHEVIERCDYILLTHIHGDHIGSLKVLQERFGAPILVNGWCAWELIQKLDLPTGSVIPMTDGCEYNFDDFKVLWMQGRHTAKVGEARPGDRTGPQADFPPEERDFMCMGTVYNSNFLLTLPNGVKIGVDGGRYEPWLAQWEVHRPTVLMRHSERDIEVFGDQLVDLARRSGCSYLIPLTRQILSDSAKTVARANEKLAENGLSAVMVDQEPGQWMEFSLGCNLK